jgi:integrase
LILEHCWAKGAEMIALNSWPITLRTKSGLPKHCSWHYDRDRNRRVRFRKAGYSTYLTGTPWSEDFMRQYAAALDHAQVKQATPVGAARTVGGTINALCAAYYASPEFCSLKPSTQAQRRRIIEKFRKDHGTKPLKGLRREHLAQIIAAKAKATPEAANNLVKYLRVMLAYGLTLGMTTSNPAIGIRRYKSKGQGFHTWTEQEIALFKLRHAAGSKARLAQALLLYTGQRPSDVCRMGWQHINGDLIAVKQEKTGTPLMLPLHPELKAMLAALPRTNMTFIVTARGAAFNAKGLGTWFKKQCKAAGLPHCSAHGLRKAAATRLANAGCSVNQIAAVTGHKSLREIAHYTAAADQTKLARQALRLQIGSESEQDFVQQIVQQEPRHYAQTKK